MFSRYLCTQKRGGVVAVFHELHPRPIYVDQHDWSLYKSGLHRSAELTSRLLQENLIVGGTHEDDHSFVVAEKCLLQKLQDVTILYLMTAQGCNANCAYCPVPGIAKRHGASRLTAEAARAGIDLWQRHLEDVFNEALEYYVIFYGGEPLLNLPVIETSLRYLEQQKKLGKLPDSIHYMVATNGLLVDNSFIDLCDKYRMSVAVGLDGDAFVNDALRVDVEGRSTHDSIVEAIRNLVSRGVATYGSCTITPYNLPQIDSIPWLFKKLGIKKFGFNFLRGQKLVDLVGQSHVETYYRNAAKAVIQAYRDLRQPGFEFQMEKKVLAYSRNDFFPLDCTCYGSQLVIQPDGQVSNCPFYKARLGDVQLVPDTFRIGNQAIVKEWRQHLPIYRPGHAKAISGGGCTWGILDQGLHHSSLDIGSKIFAEEVLNEFIWHTYRNVR